MKVYLRKFFYFGIGIFLGMLVVKALFGGRDIQCSYFPNDRVLNDLRQKKHEITPYAQCLMECYQFEEGFFERVFRESKVDFKNSEANIDMVCKKYALVWRQDDDLTWDILVHNCTSEVRVLALRPRGDSLKDCVCP
jgi:hypothetical protein